MEQPIESHRNGEQLSAIQKEMDGRTLPASLAAWPAAAADFAIYAHRQILTEGRAAGNEAAFMAIRRTRAWWRVSTLSEGVAGPRKRKAKALTIEDALEVLHRHRASLQREPEGLLVVVGIGQDAPEIRDALEALGLADLRVMFSTEAQAAQV